MKTHTNRGPFKAQMTTAALALALSACGGGGVSGISSTSTPPPTPPATPAATPTPTLAAGDYPGLRAIVAVGDPSAYGGDGITANRHPTTVHYDAASQTYVLHDSEGDPGYGFSPSEIVASQSTAAYTFYRDTSTGSTLKLLNQSTSNPLIVLTYVTYGKWVVPVTWPIILADNYVVFGQKTPAASVPRTGSASYNAMLDGTYQNQSGTYALSGGASYVANFASGSMGVTVTPVATSISNGSQLLFGQLSGGGFIFFDQSAFTAITPYDGSTKFSSEGNFYGPQATEIGGVFTIESTVGGSAGQGGGAFVGKKN
jgi:hypothetical protein